MVECGLRQNRQWTEASSGEGSSNHSLWGVGCGGYQSLYNLQVKNTYFANEPNQQKNLKIPIAFLKYDNNYNY